MADRVKLICDEFGVCSEEAFFYLEGFDWQLHAAMEACRIQTLQLPILTVESPPRVPWKVESSSEAPLTTDSIRSPNQPDERPSQSRDELIIKFYNVAAGADVEEATFYLERNNWDLQRAILHFMDECRPMPSQRKSNRKIWRSHSQPFSGDETSEAVTLQLKRGTEVSESFSPSGDYREAIVDEDSSLESSLEEAGGEHISDAIPLMASSQVKKNIQIQESSSPTQNREENLSPVKESAEVAPLIVTDSCKSSNQLQNSPEQSSQLNDKLIDLFVEAAAGGVTRYDAIAYLTLYKGDVNQAFYCLMDEGSHVFSKKETSQVHASRGSRNQGYLEEGETGSSSSSSKADPTETGNVTVAISRLASSQVDENLKDKAVDEDSSKDKAVDEDSSTIELEIKMADGGSGTQLWISIRSEETVRDIRNRVEAFRPENNRDYYFISDTGVEYRDLDTTVRRITSGSRGSTTLHQFYST